MQTTIDLAPTVVPSERKPELAIIGRDSAGRIVARDQADHPTRAERIASTWRAAGLTVETQPASAAPHKPR